MGTKRGQALMELAVGLFALALIVSVLTAFAVGIVDSLEEQNGLRVTGTDGNYAGWTIENKVDLGDLWEKFP